MNAMASSPLASLPQAAGEDRPTKTGSLELLTVAVPLVGAIMTLPGLPDRPGAADYEYDPESGAVRYTPS